MEKGRNMRIKNKHLFGSLAVAIVLLVTIGIAVSARATSRARAIRQASVPTASAAAPDGQVDTGESPQRARPIAQMESELITVTPHGFEPREITRPKGAFLLLIDNRSGRAQASTPRLSQEVGPQLREMNVPREQPNWSDLLDLQPGSYVLTEASHPAWSCHITITAQ